MDKSMARISLIALAAAAATAASVNARADEDANQGSDKDIAQLYELQAAFHEAAGGAGVDAATKAKHLQEMLEIWTADAILVVGATVYVGGGDPDASTCAVGSLTICDFFQKHAVVLEICDAWATPATLARD